MSTGAREPDDGVTAGEDAGDVGPAAQLAAEPFPGYL